MTLLLTLEHGPRGQAVQSGPARRRRTGDRPQCGSRLADRRSRHVVSRAHCTISARADGYFVTDTSSSGLFIDDGASPLGTGNSTRLRSGMRLRLGDYVVSVEVSRGAAAAPAADRTEAPATTGGGARCRCLQPGRLLRGSGAGGARAAAPVRPAGPLREISPLVFPGRSNGRTPTATIRRHSTTRSASKRSQRPKTSRSASRLPTISGTTRSASTHPSPRSPSRPRSLFRSRPSASTSVSIQARW